MSKKEYTFADEIWHRVVQIVQEAMMTGVDCADIMRQVRVVENDEGVLALTKGYKKMVNENYEKMVKDAEELKKASTSINIITSKNDIKDN